MMLYIGAFLVGCAFAVGAFLFMDALLIESDALTVARLARDNALARAVSAERELAKLRDLIEAKVARAEREGAEKLTHGGTP